MKPCRTLYHNLPRSLKTKIGVHVKQSVSKSLLQSNNRNYWKNDEIICKKNFNIVPVIDGTQGDTAIADRFTDTYSLLYNSVMLLKQCNMIQLWSLLCIHIVYQQLM